MSVLAPSRIRENFEAVRARIARACARSGRDPDRVRVVAVTKGFAVEVARAAFEAGLRDFAENYVQEARAKVGALPEATWHFVGHLQRNKAREAVRLFGWIHSVDSVPLAEELSRRAGQCGRTVEVLLQVNVAGEPQKHGARPDTAPEIAERIAGLSGLRLWGLMTIAPQSPDPEAVRWVFRELRSLRDRIQARLGTALPELSMGMTDDFEVAVEEGATMVRIGRALFGERPSR